MSDWTSGYVSDVGYTFGYYQELNPLRVKFAFLSAGIAFPKIDNVCELGFGQGISINIHGASGTQHWYGTDFNPTQAGFARELANASGANCHLQDSSFEQFCNDSSLPNFDFIGLHGIWSWVSNENKKIIVDFISRKLNVGGVLYISYNTMPGWASMAPMRHLLTEHAEVMAAPGRGIISRIDAALSFCDQMLNTNPAFLRANPSIKERFDRLKDQNRHYLAHEYFNRDWDPMHFADMEKWLAPAKLSYACSAHFLDHIDELNLTSEQQTLLKEIPDANLRETIRDFMTNAQFRRDYWVKGPRRLNRLDQLDAYRELRLVTAKPRDAITLEVQGALGEASLKNPSYIHLVDALAENKIWRLGDLETKLADKGITINDIIKVTMLLIGKGDVCLAQDDEAIQQARHTTKNLNDLLMKKSRGSNDLHYLASSVTGGGVLIGALNQLFTHAFSTGKTTPQQLADDVYANFDARGQKLVRSGKEVDSKDEAIKHLNLLAQQFCSEQLPILQKLGIL